MPSKAELERELVKPIDPSIYPLLSPTNKEERAKTTLGLGFHYAPSRKRLIVRIRHEGRERHIATTVSPLVARYHYIDAYAELKGELLPLDPGFENIPAGPHKDCHLL